MSIITGHKESYNAFQNNNFRQSRSYKRISQTNLDPSAIQTYLRSHHFNKTLAIFLIQTNYVKNITPIIQIFNKGAQNYDGSIQTYIQIIKNKINFQHLITKYSEQEIKQKWIKVQFYLYIWHCVKGDKLINQRLNRLKQYIKTKGNILSEIPQLLTYFALPYTINPDKHITLSKIFTKEWHSHVKTLIQELIVTDSQLMENQWLNIIKDMIQINQQLIKYINFDQNQTVVKQLIQRVSLYKKVIDGNESLKRKNIQKDQHSIQKQKNRTQKIQNILNISSIVDDLKKDVMSLNQLPKITYPDKLTSYQPYSSFSKLSKKVRQIYNSTIGLKKDKQFIRQLIDKDFLMIQQRQNHVKFHLQWLKLMQIMSSYYYFRTYMTKKRILINEIVDLLLGNMGMKTQIQMESVYICLNILQKLISRRQIFCILNDHQEYIQMLIHLISKGEKNLTNKDKWSIKIFQMALSNILHLIIHRTGRKHFIGSIFVQTLISILNKDDGAEGQAPYQTLICSILYLLFIQKDIRQMGKYLDLKSLLLQKFKDKRNVGYEQIVQYIIERMQYDDDIQQIQTDEDAEEQNEYEANYNEDEKQFQQYDEHKYYYPQKQNAQIEINKKEDYIGQKYNRKFQRRKLQK